MPDQKSVIQATSTSLATTSAAWVDYGTPQQVRNYRYAFISGYADVAMYLRIVQGTSATGPWTVYGSTMTIGAGVSVENTAIQERIGKSWLKLQRKSSATCVATFDVSVGV